jgi:DNA-binding MarR family transcriptional regulator
MPARKSASPSALHCVPRDSVDALTASWHERRSDLDFAPVGVISRLARVRGHIDAELDRNFAAHGLSSATFGVLVTLARIGDAGGVSQRRLMDELGLTSGTISVRMDRLLEEGLIDRRTDPASRRTSLITLSDRGRELFERVVSAHLATERRLLSALTPEEEELLTGLLRKLLVEFEGSRPPDDAPLRLGLRVAPAYVTIALRESVGLPPVAALLVRAVDDDGPAAHARIQVGDVLLRAGRQDLRSIAALYAAIDDAAGTGRLRVRLARGGDRHDVTVRLGDAPSDNGSLASTAGRSARGEHAV